MALDKEAEANYDNDGKSERRTKLIVWRFIRWPLVHLCLPLFAISLLQVSHIEASQESPPIGLNKVIDNSDDRLIEFSSFGAKLIENQSTASDGFKMATKQTTAAAARGKARHRRSRQAPWASQSAPLAHTSMLMLPMNELRVSGSKSEPPSRPSVDWSKQRPYFGSDFQRNVSVELGKTAYLTCKVFELGDKTVSWLRPRENEILTAGRYTYIGDPRFASINEPESTDWILEIKDVTLNDSTSYECQVSTDPKMSAIINLHVKAARARIKQGSQYNAASGDNIEFTCDVIAPNGLRLQQQVQQRLDVAPEAAKPQTYWYHNGNLINYARTSTDLLMRNIDVEWDAHTQTSRLKLATITPTDAGNYTCKPSSAEPATIKLYVKKTKSHSRVHYSGGSPSSYHLTNNKEAQRSRQQHFALDPTANSDSADNSAGASKSTNNIWLTTCALTNTIFLFIVAQLADNRRPLIL